MNSLVKISDWVEGQKSEFGAVELPNSAVEDQLKAYDENGTGIGFILILVPLVVNETKEAKQLDLVSVPVVKVRGEWLTPEDENIRDIFSGIVRISSPARD